MKKEAGGRKARRETSDKRETNDKNEVGNKGWKKGKRGEAGVVQDEKGQVVIRLKVTRQKAASQRTSRRETVW